jgi:hypothetical protein
MSDKSEYRRQVEAAWRQGQARATAPAEYLHRIAHEARDNLRSARATVPTLTGFQTAAFASALAGLDRLVDATLPVNRPAKQEDAAATNAGVHRLASQIHVAARHG